MRKKYIKLKPKRDNIRKFIKSYYKYIPLSGRCLDMYLKMNKQESEKTLIPYNKGIQRMVNRLASQYQEQFELIKQSECKISVDFKSFNPLDESIFGTLITFENGKLKYEAITKEKAYKK